MSIPVLICDDSSMARKQLARALPADWDIDISFACDGTEGIAQLQQGKGEILFLDLNMPVMDGYEVLEEILRQDLPTMVIVVSGDVQPEAYQRVTTLGALDFIKKPVNVEQVSGILNKFGIQIDRRAERAPIDIKVDTYDGYHEVVNIAIGRAADLLARLLNVFVVMPIPNISMIETSELQMTLHQTAESENLSAVCQGFIGSGIAGEALLIFNESSFSDIAELMKHTGDIDNTVRLELLMDIASILIGACLKGIADQLDINFSQGHPVVLGQHVNIKDILQQDTARWNKTLAVEIEYRIENRDINCDLLLLFTEDSLASLNERISYLVE